MLRFVALILLILTCSETKLRAQDPPARGCSSSCSLMVEARLILGTWQFFPACSPLSPCGGACTLETVAAPLLYCFCNNVPVTYADCTTIYNAENITFTCFNPLPCISTCGVDKWIDGVVVFAQCCC